MLRYFNFGSVDPRVNIYGVHCAGLSDVRGASQCVVPRGGIFLGKWRSSFTGSSEGKMNVQ
jgi:hypothetical protein